MNLIHLIKNLDYVCVGSVHEFFFPPYNYNVLINLNKVGTAKKKKNFIQHFSFQLVTLVWYIFSTLGAFYNTQ